MREVENMPRNSKSLSYAGGNVRKVIGANNKTTNQTNEMCRNEGKET